MKKYVKENREKTVVQLNQLVHGLDMEITKLSLGAKTSPQKDTNLLVKKKKNLAVIKTLISQKETAGN